MANIKRSEIPVYEVVTAGELEIDAKGRIWRVAKRTGNGRGGGSSVTPCAKVRAEHASTMGYLQVRATVGGKRWCSLAHRLVWMHLNGVIPDGFTINHKNGIKADNRPSNLELATYSEQALHAINVLMVGRTDQRGKRNAMVKLTVADVREIRDRRSRGETQASIARDYGVAFQTISDIDRGRSWGWCRG